MSFNSSFPQLGFGLGLRGPHVKDILAGSSTAEWYEALGENYLGLPGVGFGSPLKTLEKVRSLKPVVLHCVSMSLGSSDELNLEYFKRLRQLAEIIDPAWISDHICWTGVHGKNTHDLLPLPYTKSTVKHIADRIQRVQDILGRRLLIENVSSYAEFENSEMTEAQFVAAIAQHADCGLLLDVNNIFVSSWNHSFNPFEYLNEIPWDRVIQIHLAGPSEQGNLLIDTHDGPVRNETWSLYKAAIKNAPHAATMIEWDANIPPLATVEGELNKARDIYKVVHGSQKNSDRSL